MFTFLGNSDYSLKCPVVVGVGIILRSRIVSSTRPDLFAATTPSEVGNLVMVPNSESGLRATLPNLRRTIMTIRKTWCLILFVTASVVATSATLLASKQHQNKLQCDGGAPVPPFPTLTLVADGGAPVPPFPTIRAEGMSAVQLLTAMAG